MQSHGPCRPCAKKQHAACMHASYRPRLRLRLVTAASKEHRRVQGSSRSACASVVATAKASRTFRCVSLENASFKTQGTCCNFLCLVPVPVHVFILHFIEGDRRTSSRLQLTCQYSISVSFVDNSAARQCKTWTRQMKR